MHEYAWEEYGSTKKEAIASYSIKVLACSHNTMRSWANPKADLSIISIPEIMMDEKKMLFQSKVSIFGCKNIISVDVWMVNSGM